MTPQDTPAGPASHTVIRAGQDDIEVLSQVIADAFFSLAVCRWLIPGGEFRRRVFPAYFRGYVEHALADGTVQTTHGRDGAALWIPGTGPAAPPAGYVEKLAALTGPYLGNFQFFDDQLDSRHPRGTFHEHLAILAVRPDRQGQGIGSALLAARHAVLDDQHIPAYLEASDQRTRRIYLTRGYTDLGSPIEFADDVRMYPMWREPRTLDRTG